MTPFFRMLQELPQHARQVEDAFGLKEQTMHLCQVGEGATETNQIAELWREVQSLSEAVNAIRSPAAGRGRGRTAGVQRT